MKKKILSICLMVAFVVMSLFTFAGCNLYHDNNLRVNEEVVATVGNEKITRNDLTTWFNYYYYSCGLYYQYSEEQVYEMSLNNLIKFKLIINEAKNTSDIVITVSDQNKIWDQVFAYIDQTVDSYETSIKERYGIEEPVEEDEEKTEGTKFEEYKRVEKNYSINYDQTETVLKNTYKAPTIEENYYRYLAYQKYLAEITKTANMYSSKSYTTQEAWEEELERYYKYYEERLYVQKYNDYCLKNIEISDEAIVNAYVNDLNTQIQNFTIYDSYLSTLTNSSNNDLVLYHAGGKTFSVQQIVLEFNDMISVSHNNSTIKISEYLSKYLNDGFVFDKKDADSKIENDYIAERETHAFTEGSLNMSYIDPKTGLTTDKNGNEIIKTYADFDAELQAIVDKYNNTLIAIDQKYDELQDADKIKEETTIAEKTLVQDFYKLKFSYSKDSGVTDLTSLFNKTGYIFPEDEQDMTTSWVSEFSDAAYELYNEYLATNTFGVKTFVSNYGVHVMCFAGETEAGQVADNTIDSLNNTYFSYAINQSIADYYYDKLLNEMQNASTTNSSYYLQAMLGSGVSSVLYEKVSSILYNEYSVAGKIDIKYPKYEDIL